MATALKLRRGTTSQHASFTGSAAEVTVDTDKNTVVVHDGSTAGGIPLARESGSSIKVAAGTANAPSLSTTGDTNTGIFFPAADTIAFAEGGEERMRLDASGNLGLSQIPYAWTTSSGYKTLDFAYASFFGFNGGAGVANNATLTSTGWKYRDSLTASYYQQNEGQHQWFNAPSGIGGNAITFTQAMTLTASGNLGIGTSSPGARLGVSDGTVQLITSPFAAGLTGYLGTSTNHALAFVTNNTERMRITSSGQIGVNVTNPIETMQVNGANAVPASEIFGFSVSGVSDTTKSIRMGYDNANDMGVIAASDYGTGWRNIAIQPTGSTGVVGIGLNPTSRNNTCLQIVNGLGFPATQVSSSDPNTLDDYEEGTWTPKSGTNITVTHARYTKIGRQVTIYGTISHAGAITSYDGITLPFAPDNNGGANEARYTGGVQFFESGSGVSITNLRLLWQGNLGTTCYFWGQSGGQSWTHAIAFDGTNGINQITFTLTYIVA